MGKLNVTEVKFWLQEMSSCEERWKKECKERNFYPYLIDYYEGWTIERNLDQEVVNKRRQSIINDHFPNTNAKITEIIYKNPDIILEANKPSAMTPMGEISVEEGIPLMKGALKYVARETDMLRENRLATFDMLYAGYCAVEVDHMITRDAENSMLNIREDEKPKVSFMDSVLDTTRNFFKGAKNEEEVAENLASSQPPIEGNYANNEHTYVRRLKPEDVIFDWRADRLKDRRYQPKKVYMSKADFDRRFPDFKDKVKGGMAMDYSVHENEKHSKTILVYEIQIPVGKDMWNLVITPEYQMSELDLWKRPYTTDGYNIKVGTLHKYGKIYPIALAMINKAMSDEANNYVRFMMDVAERNIPKLLVDGGKVKADGIERLRSKIVNDICVIDGNPQNAVKGTKPTVVSTENKELLGIFEKQKTQGWSVSAQRLQSGGNADFATELQIQEAGFQQQAQDIQEGLRQLKREEYGAIKDIIVQFYDEPIFFQITGGKKPQWYEPILAEDGTVLNPLADMLTGDYTVDVDMASALRPNPERRKLELVNLLDRMLGDDVSGLLATKGKGISLQFIEKIVKQFNVDPENMFEELELPPPPPPEPLDMGETKTEQTEKVSDEMGNEKEIKTTDTTKKYDLGEEPQEGMMQ